MSASLALVLGCRSEATDPPAGWAPYDPVDHVDPISGTGGSGAQTTGVNPGAAVPFGVTLTGPDTRDSAGTAGPFYHYGGYHYTDVFVDGFSHTHSHGMGVNDYGGILVMPRAGWDPAYTERTGRMATTTTRTPAPAGTRSTCSTTTSPSRSRPPPGAPCTATRSRPKAPSR